jgi:hypothetical protein
VQHIIVVEQETTFRRAVTVPVVRTTIVRDVVEILNALVVISNFGFSLNVHI